MKEVMISQGAATVSNVPSPTVEAGTVLVHVDHSCISVGTELSGMKSSGESIWKKALQQPDRIKQVADLARNQGIRATKRMVERKTDNLRTADKGHLQELRAFGEAVKGIGDWPIPLWQQIQATEIAFNVEKQITHD